IVEAGVNRLRDHLDSRHRVIVSPTSDIPPLPLDADRIDQVVANLLDNAVKYSPTGGDISVAVEHDDSGASVTIRDAGIGLPPGAEQAIFEPFGRAANAAHHSLPGMGLGLYICRNIVELHGGWIRAESPGEGQGATLRFWLPANVPES
ncbi:MAG: sensor histidine kinase, partial [Vicinamibacterales bacterium]